MEIFGLLLTFSVPIALWMVAGRVSSSRKCFITGVATGAVIYPLLYGMTLFIMNLGGLALISIGRLISLVTLLHGLPGRMGYYAVFGRSPRGDNLIELFIISGVVWAIVYGAIAVLFYKIRARSKPV